MKKKHIFSLTLILTLFSIIFFSCNKSKDDAINKNGNPDAVTTDNLAFYDSNYKGYQAVNSEKGIVIIRVKLWRKSQDCLHGVGICSVEILPDLFDGTNGLDRDAQIPIISTFDGGIVNLYFAEDVSAYTESQLMLYVDEDIYVVDDNELFESAFKFPTGAYYFNLDLGDFGGYEIPVEKI